MTDANINLPVYTEASIYKGTIAIVIDNTNPYQYNVEEDETLSIPYQITYSNNLCTF
jgi:hypothetical protein